MHSILYPMKTVFGIVILLLFASHVTLAQSAGFPFGQVTYNDLEMNTYEKDTAAAAVILNEFGEAYIESGNDYNLILKYHVKIKILKKSGLDHGDFEILLRKVPGKSEVLRSVKASTFNIENGPMKESKFDAKNVFTEDKKYYHLKKFALPNVRVGSVIDLEYVLESPFIQNFRSWEFQCEIPKVKSEYWALVPANYKYNIALRGYLNLSSNESTVVKNCFSVGGGSADCTQLKFSMQDIPAFIEEDYMTAKSNFVSAIRFELSEIEYFDGRKDKITKAWKDAEDELRRDPKFGLQLKRGKDIVDKHIDPIIAGENDPLVKAEKIYDFVKGWYRWNEYFGEYSEFGIKKAFDTKVGNVGDINLSLVAALRYAGLSVEPLLLSTRANGWVTELYPVLSEFNYVIAKLNIGDKVYLLDATDSFLSFGLIPERCLNGKGRVIGDTESYWYDLTAPERERQISVQNLKMSEDGTIKGKIQNKYFGYDAMKQRKLLHASGNEKEYIAKLSRGWNAITITDFKMEHSDDFGKPLIITFDVEISDFAGASSFLFNPFLIERWEKNPFKSSERSYPVDFGVPIEEIVVMNLQYPESLQIEDLPEKVGLALPNSGGRYLFNIQNSGTTLSMNSSFTINRTLFTSEEYHYLKELFARVVASQRTDLVFKRKS